MKIYFNDENLINSHQSDREKKYLLFRSRSGVFPFVKYEEDLSALNDYCCLILGSLKQKSAEVAKYKLDGEDVDFRKIEYTKSSLEIENSAIDAKII